MRRTRSTWTGAPTCEAQMIAVSGTPQPKWSIVPSSTHGRAWNGLADERQYVEKSASPYRATSTP